jgi:hypothetical protein
MSKRPEPNLRAGPACLIREASDESGPDLSGIVQDPKVIKLVYDV